MNDRRNPTYEKPRNYPASAMETGTMPALRALSPSPAASRDSSPSLAVALHYSGRGAPRVTAKGAGHIAKHIVDIAKLNNVPLEEDAALVGALSRIDLGREIPRELWIAVAHVLAFAWSVSGKRKL